VTHGWTATEVISETNNQLSCVQTFSNVFRKNTDLLKYFSAYFASCICSYNVPFIDAGNTRRTVKEPLKIKRSASHCEERRETLLFRKHLRKSSYKAKRY
jgi:hypothetical protein